MNKGIRLFNLFFCFCLIVVSSIDALLVRPKLLDLNVSVIVPCHYKHFPLLEELLINFSHQTVHPLEIVVSLSECELVEQEKIDALENTNWPFAIKILRNPEKLYGGQNRNRASQVSVGDILIYQDADDVPHPQRVEIVKALFDRYELDHLYHAWIHPTQSFASYTYDQYVNLCADCKRISDLGHKPTYGNVSVTREVFNAVKWPEYSQKGEDADFNSQVYAKFQHTAYADVALLMYRYQYSVYSPRG